MVYKLVTCRRIFLVAILLLLLLQSCERMRGNPGYLRGAVILRVRFPMSPVGEESIGVADNRVAARSFVPVTAQTDIERVVISDELWESLKTLRDTWCRQPPVSLPATQGDNAYRVVFQCGYDENPVTYITEADLPAVLRELIDLVPPARPD